MAKVFLEYCKRKNVELVILSFFWLLIVLFYFLKFDLFGIYSIAIFLSGISTLSLSFFRKNEILSPAVLMPLMYAFYALGPLKYSADYSDVTIINYLFSQYLGLTGLLLGLRYQGEYQNNLRFTFNQYKSSILNSFFYCKEKHSLFSSEEYNSLYYSIVITWLFSILSIFFLFMSYGGIYNFFNVGYGGERFLIAQSNTSFGGSFAWLGLSSILMYIYANSLCKKKMMVVSILTFIFSVLINITTGGRSTIVYLLIYLIAYVHYSIYRFPKYIVVIAIFLGMILAQMYSHARYFFPQGFIQTLVEMIKMTFSHPEAFLPWKSGEFHHPARSLMDILQKGSPPMQYGLTLLSAIVGIIPFLSKLTNGVTINPSDWMMNKYYPEVFKRGGGYGFSPVTEAYINFGFVGILPIMFIIGILTALIYNNHARKQSLSSLLLLLGVLPIGLLDVFRNTLESSVYKLSRIYLFPWIVFNIVFFIRKQFYKNINLD